jgi:hypothetical protein
MKQKKTKETENKVRGLFDHVNHIREVKNPEYYQTLSDAERNSFNKYMLLRVLSMDSDIIEEMAFVSKYFQNIPNEQFYKLLIEVVPKGRRFSKYIKKTAGNVNETILTCICDKFKIGQKDAADYYNVFMTDEKGIKDLVTLIESFGYSEKEVEKMFS